MSAQPSPRVAALLEKTRRSRGRLIFALDATASREPMWDIATQLQNSMFEEAARIGGLEVQLVWYRGHDECSSTPWTSDTSELAKRMLDIRCQAGTTKIARVLQHIRAEHERAKISAAVFIGDAVEESPDELYAAAAGLGVPMFMFQEGDAMAVVPEILRQPYVYPLGPKVEEVFRWLARMTGGAWGKFDAGAAKQLGELLRAVAAFAVGGVKALAGQHTESARKLLGQLK
jgi:hypothetical protein